MKKPFLLLFFALILITSGCQSKPVCPQGDDTGLPKHLTAEDLLVQTTQPVSSSASPVEMKINGNRIIVDKVVEGPLCNDKWQGTIYVGCNVQVLEWEEKPFFLKSCDLAIAEGTVVYVADHNNTAYYNGCSCHTGQVVEQK